jgi:hypothetical protein
VSKTDHDLPALIYSTMMVIALISRIREQRYHRPLAIAEKVTIHREMLNSSR